MADPSSKTPNTVHIFPPKEGMTATEVMAHCSNEVATGDIVDVLIIGLDGDGRLVLRTSDMPRMQANWLCDMAKLNSQGRL